MPLTNMNRQLASTIPQTGGLGMNTQMNGFLNNSNIGTGMFGNANVDPRLMAINNGSLAGSKHTPPQSKFNAGMGLAGLAFDGAGLLMNYQAMNDQRQYNKQNMALLQQQQGLAKRAADVNYSNQQSMAAQMV